jgi:hydroxymethylpyrimidine pyrophosphatase-like HAD family hydrolase
MPLAIGTTMSSRGAIRAMRYQAFATDYDGTIACDGIVDESTVDALRRVRAAGLKTVLVTGRELSSLFNTFAHADVFDRIVAENGAVLYDPATGAVQTLGSPPPPALVQALQQAQVPMLVGHSIIATVTPYEHEVLRAIHELRLEWHVIFNKEAVMALPSDVTKATGLAAALRALSLTPEQTVAVGDAENDQAFLRFSGMSAAVENALDGVKELVDVITRASRGAGVRELIDQLLSGALDAITPDPNKHLPMAARR